MDRETEKLKYRDAYKDPNYRMGTRRREVLVDLLRTTGGNTLLDVGCGRGELLMEAELLGFKAHGYEVVPGLVVANDVELIDGLHQLPAEARSYDVVVCADVLEHVTEEDSIRGLHDMVRVAKQHLLLTVAWFPHVHQGVELHVNRHPMEWWLEQLDGIQWVMATTHRELPGDWGWILAELD